MRSQLIVIAGVFWLIVSWTLPASAQESGVQLRATLNGRPVSQIDSNDPLSIAPNQALKVSVLVSNHGSGDAFVRTVRIDGRVLAMTFISYATRVDLNVPAGKTRSRQFDIDLSDLDANATGLLPARIALLDSDRNVLDQEGFPVDVNGSLRSSYGIFGLLVAIATIFLLVAGLIRLARGLLPANRWYRGVRFAVIGLGLGLTFVFSLSALGILLPSPVNSLALVVVGGLSGLLFGYLTPSPRAAEAEKVVDLREQDAPVMVPGPTASPERVISAQGQPAAEPKHRN